jgi:hypothetical protein
VIESYEEVKSGNKSTDEFESDLNSIDINPEEFVPILDALKPGEKKKRLMQLLEIKEVHPKVGSVVRDKDLKFLDVENAITPMKNTWVISKVAQTGYRHRDYSLKKARVLVIAKPSRVPFIKISFVIVAGIISVFVYRHFTT